jgi:hypothetical protein
MDRIKRTYGQAEPKPPQPPADRHLREAEGLGLPVRLLAMLLCWFLLYGVGAFMAWELNPGSWHVLGRVFAGFLACLSALVFLFIIED